MRCLLLGFLWAQQAYNFYTPQGKKVSYTYVLKKARAADIILIGELHNNPLSHWLEIQLAQDLGREHVCIGAEMFETDQQTLLDNYLQGKIDSLTFRKYARLWPNYDQDYAQLVEWCKKNQIPLYATNAPRALARKVAYNGWKALDSFTSAQAALIAPLSFPRLDSLPTYQEMKSLSTMHGINPENLMAAQMLKDATMAHFIVLSLREGSCRRLIHLHGSYHSDYKEGIAAYLRLWEPKKNLFTLSTLEADPLNPPKDLLYKRADVILVVSPHVSKTY
ncbi:MAG: ChaN family lipoprotein [Bacteroidia bacterium]